ncbi:hypothetical protein ABIE44_003033 [Marmoricola sp. OAE513]|uniref:hypothetical protein n=1 Tax=Marmoricola sp. OAE513 TaxID=2817894 RepID=UPI001AE5681F
MELSIELPVDNDGFLRRECPHCEQEFKWHHGPANEEAEHQQPADAYFCPLCGQVAGPDSWWTQAQLDLIQAEVSGHVGSQLNDMFDDAFRGLRGGGLVRVETSGGFDDVETPEPLDEPDDMSIVASPCHGWEPVKVPENASGPFYCLVCGAAFAV